MNTNDIEQRIQKLNDIIARYEAQLSALVHERDQILKEFRETLKQARIEELHHQIKGTNGTAGTAQTNS